MSITITDISELAQYHLVLSEPDDEQANANLAQPLVTALFYEHGSTADGGRRRGSSAAAVGARSIPSSSTRRDTTTPTMATSTTSTAGRCARATVDQLNGSEA